MQIHFGAEALAPEWDASVVCIGTFDGVHLGHSQVIGAAVALGRKLEIPTALVTFDRHPLAALRPGAEPKAISSLSGNLRRFEALGVAVSLVLPFTESLASTTAQAFFDHALRDKLRAAQVVVWHDFAFGKGREGSPQWLADRLPTTVIPPFLVDGERVASSKIRQAIEAGDFVAANRWLGREWAIPGAVVAGQRLGRTLGFPTINLARSFQQVCPPDGVYAGRCETRHGEFLAAIGIGFRPTVAGTHRTIEAYLLDYSGEPLYGDAVLLRFSRRLRGEEKFDSLDALKAQMERDVAQVRAGG